jgi:hypothetical protein
MLPPRARATLLGLLLALAACPRPPPPPDPDAGASAAGLDGGADAGVADAGVDAGPASDPDAGVPYQVHLWIGTDGGLEEARLPLGAAAQVEPTSRLVLEVWPRPEDARVRLFDAADQVLDSDDSASALDGGWRYQLTLPDPLKGGRTYTLVLDAEQGPGLVDARGRPLDDLRLGLQVRGEPGPDPASSPKGKKKRR